MSQPFISLILLSGGKGLRMGSSLPKQYMPFLGKTLAWHSLDFFLKRKEISEIMRVIVNYCSNLLILQRIKKSRHCPLIVL